VLSPSLPPRPSAAIDSRRHSRSSCGQMAVACCVWPPCAPGHCAPLAARERAARPVVAHAPRERERAQLRPQERDQHHERHPRRDE
jgi:hypothetical protein